MYAPHFIAILVGFDNSGFVDIVADAYRGDRVGGGIALLLAFGISGVVLDPHTSSPFLSSLNCLIPLVPSFLSFVLA